MKLLYNEYEGAGARVESYADVDRAELCTYIDSLFRKGYTAVGERTIAKNRFLDMRRGEDAVFLSYYDEIRELRAVYETDIAYFEFSDDPRASRCLPLLTQVDTHAFGMSYAIRLCDGRFIVFDGGWEMEEDADPLMRVLLSQSDGGRPIIAAWIMTHPHIDHYRCAACFLKKYGENVTVERFIYNFPDKNTCCAELLEREGGDDPLNRFYFAVAQSGARVYRAHTGQIYNIGGASMEILASPDDAFYSAIDNLNVISLVVKLRLAGQTILFPADSCFAGVKLKERWGRYLKSDILQVTHHGFPGGDIETYDLIAPETCIVPNREVIYFECNCIHRPENQHIVYDMGVRDLFIGGSGDVILQLPYRPRENGMQLLAEMATMHRENVGECEQRASGKIRIENRTYFDIKVIAGEREIQLPYLQSTELEVDDDTLITSDYPVKIIDAGDS